jgi:hypothetical protein
MAFTLAERSEAEGNNGGALSIPSSRPSTALGSTSSRDSSPSSPARYPAPHRVASKHELKERIMVGIDDINRHPVIHTWSHKLAEAA